MSRSFLHYTYLGWLITSIPMALTTYILMTPKSTYSSALYPKTHSFILNYLDVPQQFKHWSHRLQLQSSISLQYFFFLFCLVSRDLEVILNSFFLNSHPHHSHLPTKVGLFFSCPRQLPQLSTSSLTLPHRLSPQFKIIIAQLVLLMSVSDLLFSVSPSD